jgi:hypothetical protein
MIAVKRYGGKHASDYSSAKNKYRCCMKMGQKIARSTPATVRALVSALTAIDERRPLPAPVGKKHRDPVRGDVRNVAKSFRQMGAFALLNSGSPHR